VVLAACAGPQPTEPETEPDQEAEAAAERAELRERGEALLAQQRPLAAVRVYRRLAERAEPDAQLRWELRIVEVLFEADHPELALAWHRRIEGRPAPPELMTRKRLADARAAVERRQGVRALRLLPLITSETPDDVRARILAIRADAYGVSGQPVRAFHARLARTQYLETDEARRANDDAIWALLQSVPADRLGELAKRDDVSDRVRGWAELAQAVRRSRLGERGIKSALADWRSSYPNHPAQALSRDLEDRVLEQFKYPEKVALLLPLTGELGEPAKAIRDGLLAAYYDQPDYVTRPRVAIYDTGDEGATVKAAYDRAVDEGAGFVVGPLAKDGVRALAARDALEVPVLTLNYTGSSTSAEGRPSALYQFGLLPEDEARQAAEAATQNGHFNALALTPSGDWGRRMHEAFHGRFDELGGQTLEHARYNARATDYGRPIRRLLNLDASSGRNRRLESTIDRDVVFEPRRRQDVEVIFAPSMAKQARLIKPQLEFHRAADIPVYATSHAFTGAPDRGADFDVNGLNFTETPWVIEGLAHLGRGDGLHARVARAWPQRHERMPRLYALGIDAFSLLPHLGRLGDDETAGLAGRTGRLTLDSDNEVHRQLQWARFVQGVPIAVPRPEAPIGPHFDDWIGLDRTEGDRDP